ncbi:MOSC domain-containing protein [Thermosipho ferrireducens]|uniref:MOSC domain-containing protein n=1 Tax=Thermosipho ferrireducens TaxID=2571116 RepID=A0ABX7S704_9BACT|nr:MOSC domain-containing protein [Thermosipho ferrireducens]QTA38359.1 MOSC domain-containing protein [Thermosipho ferrireducens]
MKKIIGKIVSLNISEKRGTIKKPVEQVELIENFGIRGDAHAGNWLRQVSMLAVESIEKMRKKGIDIEYGEFAENITIEAEKIYKWKLGAKIKIKEAVLEVTQIGKQCHDFCDIKKRVGTCVMPLEGVFLKVIKGGIISVGDVVEIISEVNES